MDEHESGDETNGGAGLGRTLARLKTEGGNLLVVGALPSEMHARACESLFETPGETPGRRVIATICSDPDLDARLPSGAPRDPDHLAVVETDHTARSGAVAEDGHRDATDPSPAQNGYDVRRVDAEDPSDVAEGVRAALEDLGNDGSTRVCVDGLGTLFADHDRGDVVTFCHELATQIENDGSQGHFHLAVDPDDRRVSALYPVFDVVLELRLHEGVLQQRWRIRGGENSGWIPL